MDAAGFNDLQIVTQRACRVTYRSETSYRHVLHACGLSYQKVEKVYRSQPQAVRLGPSKGPNACPFGCYLTCPKLMTRNTSALGRELREAHCVHFN